jgi:protein-tyrosine-phosphatase
MTVVFVCTGNSCRSPMAAAYFDALCRQRSLDIHVLSAGIAASGGYVSDHAREILKQNGLEPLDNRSRQLDGAIVADADLIVTMSHAHADCVREEFPEAEDKTHPLSDYNHFHGDVPDPVGGTLDTYRQVFELMKPSLEILADKLAGNR